MNLNNLPSDKQTLHKILETLKLSLLEVSQVIAEADSIIDVSDFVWGEIVLIDELLEGSHYEEDATIDHVTGG